MVKLKSGDMVRFDVGNGGKAVLHVIGRDDAPRVEESGYGWNDGDTVVLVGSEVALLLHRLSTVDADGYVTAGTPTSSMLLVRTLHDEAGEVTVVLKTDRNEIHMKAYERDMLVNVVNSRTWMLFL